jgi:hypothetical protein
MAAGVPQKHRVLDSKRFVEFWVTYADPALQSTKISVPLLADDLFLRGQAQAVASLKVLRPEALRYFPDEFDGLVLTGDTADASENEVEACCQGLPLHLIRRWSYPAVFYREVRCGYVHELNPTDQASRLPGGRSAAPVSYLNSVRRPFRRIHFNIEWICLIIEGMARRAYDDWQRDSSRCALRWWLDGA